jgi:putative oxidoreductase
MFTNHFPPVDKPLPQRWTDLASLILRAGMAVVFIYHGLDKILHDSTWGANWMHKWFNVSADTFETPALNAIQLAIAWGEVLGGGALGVGLLTRLAAFCLIILQGGAAGFAYSYTAFSMSKGGGPEYNFVLMTVCLTLIVLGPGRLALDRFLRRSSKPEVEVKTATESEPVVAVTR